MREILFRGKRDKEWIEGIATDTDMFYHYNFSKVLVIGNIHDTSKLAKEESE